MESLTVSNQNIVNLAQSNTDRRMKRRNGLNQFQFEQQIKNANLTTLQLTMTDLSIADTDDSMTDQLEESE